jgi:hypothetical protein
MRREPGKIQRSGVDAERAREDTGDPESMQGDPQSRGERLYQPFSSVEIFFYFFLWKYSDVLAPDLF